MIKTITLFAVLFSISLPAFAAGAPAGTFFQRVFIVVLENESYVDSFKQPFMRRFAQKGAHFVDFRAATHPSYPNYIAMTAGSTLGVRSNAQRTLDSTHIGDLLEAKGYTWKNYAEGYPGDCWLHSSKRAYSRKHVPFLSYRNVQEDPARCARVVPAEQLKADIEQGTLPHYAMFTPDNNSNGHDTGVAYADRWLAKTFGPLLQDRRFMEGTLFVLTYDEDDGRHGNRVYTTFFGDMVRPGTIVRERHDFYTLLRTIEENFGLGTLGREDAKASPITGIWR